MKTVPLCFQKTIYDYGMYNQGNIEPGGAGASQTWKDMYTASGESNSFMDEYNALCAFPDMTDTVDDSINTFIMMVNGTPHEPIML